MATIFDIINSSSFFWPYDISFYYLPEVRRGEYFSFGVFQLQYYIPLVKIGILLHHICINMNVVG